MIIQNAISFYIILFTATILSLMIIFIYKFTTNQEEMKRIKDRMKELQLEIKKNKSDQKKVMELNSELLKLNSEYMHKSIKTSFYTFIPAMLLLWFLYSFVVAMPVYPNADFSLSIQFNSSVNFDDNILKNSIVLPEGFELLQIKNKGKTVDYIINAPGKEGKYNFTFNFNNQTFVKEVVVSKGRKKVDVSKNYEGFVKNIKVNDIIVKLPFWPYYLSWLWVYILVSIPLNSLFRKWFDVY